MNRALEMWKDLPHLSGDVPSPTGNCLDLGFEFRPINHVLSR